MDNPNIMFGRAFRSAKRRALQRNISFDITMDYLIELYNSQDGKCFYSGERINVVKENENRTHDPFKMTLDCLVPQKGYVRGNVVWCAYCVNSMKQKMSISKMLSVCSSISKRADGNCFDDYLK